VVIVVVGASRGVSAQPAKSAEDAELEARFRAEVERANPQALASFDAANAARERGDPELALRLYRETADLVPTVATPRRRACGELARLERVDEARTECEAALQIDPTSPYTKSMLAMVLLGSRVTADQTRALELARDAVDAAPDDETAVYAWCTALISIGVDGDDTGELEGCIRRFIAVAPDNPMASVYSALLEASYGNQDAARAHLERAHLNGLPDEQYERMRADLASGRLTGGDGGGGGLPLPGHTFLVVAAIAGAVWLGVMIILFVTGYVLSRLTLATVGGVTAGDAGATEGTAREQRLRRLYRFVLAASGVYFYLSIPMLIALIVLAGGGAIYFFFAVGYIPIKLTLVLGIVVVVTIGAILRSLVIRSQPAELGMRIDLEQNPKLRAMLDEVGASVGTRRADVAYLTPGTELAVTERAGVWKSVRGARTERSLILGVGLFDGMTQLQLRSVLAHEHGHYRNADTAGGGLALAVRRSLMVMMIRLASSGAASGINPVWWFLRGYHRIYLVISQGASRLQEVLADRWAVQAYGTVGFVAGYRHVVARSVEFDHHANASLKEVIEHDRALPNLYQFKPATAANASATVETEIADAMKQPPSVYDSHPAPAQRIQWAEALAVVREPRADDDAPIWELFADRDAVERAMTARVRDSIREQHGHEIAAEAKPAEAKPAEPKPSDAAADSSADAAEAS
jgi:Zn-dependent protease with chaperone function